MKTLILNGSPRLRGDTASLINLVTAHLHGEYKIVNAYFCNISACVDCRFCWENSGCTIQDEMQQVYSYIEECDNIIIASPIYFSELTGKLLDVASRLQMYYCAKHFRNEAMTRKVKKGAVILAGGGDGDAAKAYDTACTILHHMNCFDILPPVICHNTNVCPAKDSPGIVEKLDDIAAYLNKHSH